MKKYLLIICAFLAVIFPKHAFSQSYYEYDDYGNITRVDRGGGAYSEYEYDNKTGNIISAVTYDTRGSIKESVTYNYDTGTKVASVYDGNGRLTRVDTYKNAGEFRRVDYGPNEGALIQTYYTSYGDVDKIVENFYDETGLNTGYAYKRPNGEVYATMRYTYDYDANGNITKRYINGSLDYTYEYDAYGNLIQLKKGKTLERSFTYSDPNWRQNVANKMKYNGKPLLYGKRIYTVEEATEATKNGTKFHVGITYK